MRLGPSLEARWVTTPGKVWSLVFAVAEDCDGSDRWRLTDLQDLGDKLSAVDH